MPTPTNEPWNGRNDYTPVMSRSAADTADEPRDLTEQGSDLLNNVTETVRNNPITSVLVGLGIGFLLASIVRR